ncbi:MAG: VWA domain-containing protein [Kiritimatiellae bacterium]|nr:VWA domain-containing protein [Kiritimatiellia bacterium]
MISFAYPWVLLLLGLAPVLAWQRHRSTRRPVVQFSDGEALRALPAGWGARAARVLPYIYGLGLALLVVAAARPRWGTAEARVNRDTVDMMLVVDLSPSMLAEDFSTPTRRMNRYDAARTVIEDFAAQRPDDRMGAVVFARRPYTLVPLTHDHGFLLDRIRQMSAGDLGDATGIGTALAAALARLERSESRSRVVILLTDGMSNVGIPPAQAAEAARSLGVRVYTIGAGTRGMAPMPVNFFGHTVYQQVPVEIDEASLRQIAELTGGEYFRATDLKSLETIYRQIDRMERTKVEATRFIRYEERFVPWLAAALLLLAAERLLSLGRLRECPA